MPPNRLAITRAIRLIYVSVPGHPFASRCGRMKGTALSYGHRRDPVFSAVHGRTLEDLLRLPLIFAIRHSFGTRATERTTKQLLGHVLNLSLLHLPCLSS